MLIDLHCHTKATKKGDGQRRNVDAETFVKRVNGAGVGIVAITNHNHFDIDQYRELKEAAASSFQVWPGVELDVKGSRNGSHWHMLAICSPANVEGMSAVVQGLVAGKPPNDCLFDFADVKRAFEGFDVLFVSHCHDKRPYANEADLKEILDEDDRPWNYFFEPRTLVTVGIMSSHGLNMMLGSDVKDWSDYPACELPQLRLPVDSFEQFALLAKRDGRTINTMLDKVSPTRMTAHPHNGVDVGLPIFNEVNVLFGQKGTGKSEIARTLAESAVAQGLSCARYTGNQKTSDFDDLLKSDSVPRSPSIFGIDDFQAAVEEICEWEDGSPTPISGYVDWVKTRGNNKKKERFAIAQDLDLPVRDKAVFERHAKAQSEISGFRKKVESGGYSEYLEDDEMAVLRELLRKLEAGALSKRKDEFVGLHSELLANKSLALLKNEIDRKSSTRSMPGSVGYASFAQKRLSLMRNVELVEAALSPKEKVEREYLGRFDDKGIVNLATSYRMLCSESRTAEFKGKISDLRNWRSCLDELSGSMKGGNVSEAKEKFAAIVDSSGVKSAADFIGVRRYVEQKSTGRPYSPSDGEKGILLLERVLNQQVDWYVLDEPEAGMSNSYIDGVIRPRIVELGKSGKTVLVATHNANLAVRTLPYGSIYRAHVDGDEYKTYIGNPFVDRLENVSDASDSLSWSEKSMEVLEGGEEAFFERLRVYEAGAR